MSEYIGSDLFSEFLCRFVLSMLKACHYEVQGIVNGV